MLLVTFEYSGSATERKTNLSVFCTTVIQNNHEQMKWNTRFFTASTSVVSKGLGTISTLNNL